MFFIAFATLQIINKRFWMHDFQVYYDATVNFFSGRPVYGELLSLGSGYYKYSPFGLFLFFPFTLVDFGVAKVIYFAFLSATIIITVMLSNRMVSEMFFKESASKHYLIMLFIITIAFIQHIYFELHLGNINILLLLLSLLALQLLVKDKEWAAGLLLASAILIKPHFLILIPLFLLRKRFAAVAFCLGGIAAGLIIPSLYTGFGGNIQMLQQWKETMLIHNQNPVNGQDTIYSWVYRLLGISMEKEGQLILILSVLAVVALLVFALFLYHQRKEASKDFSPGTENKNSVFEYLLLVALIPNLTVTDSEHFLFSVPLITWLINYIFIRKPGYLVTIIICIILLMYGGNLRELIGTPASRWMTETGILGLGNILLIGVSIYVMIFQPGKELKETPLNISND